MAGAVATDLRGVEGGTDCPNGLAWVPVNVLGRTRSTLRAAD
jgi:hypothetical protein